jgi:hypothetical protein
VQQSAQMRASAILFMGKGNKEATGVNWQHEFVKARMAFFLFVCLFFFF